MVQPIRIDLNKLTSGKDPPRVEIVHRFFQKVRVYILTITSKGVRINRVK